MTMAALESEPLELLRRVVDALEPWSDHYVLVGGWAMQVFRLFEGMEPDVEVSHTYDVDIAIDGRLPDGHELRPSLERARLVSIPSRATQPPITRFQIAERGEAELAPEHLEFLVPMRGKQTTSVVEIGGGIGAEALRYLDLSFAQARTVPLSKIAFLRKGRSTGSIRVPSPASYLMAKALTLTKRRNPSKRDKDYAYIYLLARMSRQIWADLHRDFEALDVHPKWRRAAQATLAKSFSSVSADGVVGAVRSMDDPQTDAVLVYAVMHRFLSAMAITHRSS